MKIAEHQRHWCAPQLLPSQAAFKHRHSSSDTLSLRASLWEDLWHYLFCFISPDLELHSSRGPGSTVLSLTGAYRQTGWANCFQTGRGEHSTQAMLMYGRKHRMNSGQKCLSFHFPDSYYQPRSCCMNSSPLLPNQGNYSCWFMKIQEQGGPQLLCPWAMQFILGETGPDVI